MLQKIQENTERFNNLLSEAPFCEGKCSIWHSGEGLFIQKLSDQSQFLVVFESNGTFKSYELSSEVLSA